MVPYARSSNPIPLGFWKPASGSACSDAEVLDWVSRVVGNGGTVSASTQASACTFMAALNTASIRSKILRLNLYAGDQLAACLVPFIKDKGSTLDAIVVAGTGSGVTPTYTEATGLVMVGNLAGVNGKIIDTGFVGNTDWSSDDNAGMGVYMRTKLTTTDVCMGDAGGGNVTYLLPSYGGTTTYGAMYGVATQQNFADTNGLGHYMVVRRASNDMSLFRNGASQVTTTTPGGNRPSGGSMWVHAYNAANPTCSGRLFAGYQITAGLTASEVLALYNAVQAFQTSLSRNV